MTDSQISYPIKKNESSCRQTLSIKDFDLNQSYPKTN